jgi:hypothetical protein
MQMMLLINTLPLEIKGIKKLKTYLVLNSVFYSALIVYERMLTLRPYKCTAFIVPGGQRVSVWRTKIEFHFQPTFLA